MVPRRLHGGTMRGPPTMPTTNPCTTRNTTWLWFIGFPVAGAINLSTKRFIRISGWNFGTTSTWSYGLTTPRNSTTRAHACIIHTLVDITRWFPFIHCLSEQFMARQGQEFNESVAYCFNAQKIKKSEQEKILDCAAGPLGYKLQEEFIAKGDAVKPEKPRAFPWIVLNGFSSLKNIMYKQNLLMAFCFWYSGDPVPKPCRLENLFKGQWWIGDEG